MRMRKADKNILLEGKKMENYFPALVKKFNSRKFGGKTSDVENETILNPSGSDLVEGYVSLYSTAGDISKIIQRASKAILKMKISYDVENQISGVDFHIKKDAFRGAVFAFNTKYAPEESYETNRTLSDEHIAKMQKGRKNAKKTK